MDDVGFMIGSNGMVGYDIVLGKVTYSYGQSSPTTQTGYYDGHYVARIDDVGMSNFDHDRDSTDSPSLNNNYFAYLVESDGGIVYDYWNVTDSYGEINHSYQIQLRALII